MSVTRSSATFLDGEDYTITIRAHKQVHPSWVLTITDSVGVEVVKIRFTEDSYEDVIRRGKNFVAAIFAEEEARDKFDQPGIQGIAT